MERLTERYKDPIANTVLIKECGDKLCKNICDDIEYDCSKCGLEKALEKLADYEDLEEQGLLVRLPCKVGDIMFRINKGAKNPIIELTVTQINITRRSYNLEVIDRDCGELMCFKNDIGKTIFLTREEAEKKLEEMEKGINVVLAKMVYVEILFYSELNAMGIKKDAR